MSNAIITVQGGPVALPTLLGQAPARIPTGGKIRPGIMVLTKRAAEVPQAKDIYRQGVAEGRSFEQIERTLKEALPQQPPPPHPQEPASGWGRFPFTALESSGLPLQQPFSGESA